MKIKYTIECEGGRPCCSSEVTIENADSRYYFDWLRERFEDAIEHVELKYQELERGRIKPKADEGASK